VFASYPACCSALKWLTLSLFSYVGTVLVIHVPWKAAMKGTFLPSIQFKGSYWATMIALLGTTISPYLFFWQASQETEEIRNVPQDERLKDEPRQAREQFGRIRFDTYIGMAFSNLVAYFIILAAAATLNTHGVTDVQTSAQAAEALRPHCRKVRIFSILFGNHWDGSFGGACNGWFSGIRRRRSDAMAHRARSKTRGSQGILWHLTIASLLGLAINFPTVQHLTHLSPIKALFWSAVINGVVAGPIMIVMMLMCHNKNVMGQFVNVSRILRIMGWLATGAMLFAAVGLFVTWND
jgi:Mn2+/Fe2+ NRAMP family transporter